MARIGFDLHGVLSPYDKQLSNGSEDKDDYLLFMTNLLSNTRSEGYEVWIVSGPPIEEIRAELDALGYEMGVHYDQIVSVVDWLRKTGAEMTQDDKGHWWASEEEWWSAKAKLCAYHEISELTDDRMEYGQYFKPPLIFHPWSVTTDKMREVEEEQ